jgi:hypothetical protein
MVVYSLAADAACAWIVTVDSLVRVDLGNGPELAAQCRGVGARLRGAPAPRDSAAQVLGDALRNPVAARIPGGIRQLVVVPDPSMVCLAPLLPGSPADSSRGWLACWAPSAGSWVGLMSRRLPVSPVNRWVGVEESLLSGIRPETDEFELGTDSAAAGAPTPKQLTGDGPGQRMPDLAGCAVLIGTYGDASPQSLTADPAGAQPRAHLSAGMVTLARVHEALEQGAGAVVLRWPDTPPDPTHAWMAAFHRALSAGSSPAQAARTADLAKASQADAPADAAAGPRSVVFGDAFDPVKLAPARRIVPWVGGVALGTLVLAITALLLGVRKRE